MSFTKGQIRKLGVAIRQENPNIADDTLKSLQAYRVSYKDALSDVFNILCKHSLKIRSDSIVTYRVKRIESIIDKLERFPNMAFDRMWDIAGCRCIIKDEENIYKLGEELSKDLVIRKINDYIKNNKKTGYKSLHIYVSPKNDDSKIIEIQLRTQIDHNWATLVEITDFLYGTKIKERNSEKKLGEFHLLLSKIDILTIKEKQKIFETIKDYDYLKKLNIVFKRNYISVRRQWLSIENHDKNNFFLIEAKRDDVPKINSYSSFLEAEEEYFIRFKKNSDSNIVLTHLAKANYAQISIAYANYILTYHKFIDDCYIILESLLNETFEKNKLFLFIRCFDFYLSTAADSISNLKLETKSLGSTSYYNQDKINEWFFDINTQIENIKIRIARLTLIFKRNTPKSKLYASAVMLVVRFLSYKYSSRLKK